MNQDQNRITFLLEKYRSRSASEVEEHELYQLIAAEENETAIKDWLMNVLQQEQTNADVDKSKWQTILQQILDHGKEKQQSSTGKLRTISTWKRIAIAASILITIGIAAYVTLSLSKGDKEQSHASPLTTHDVSAPDKNRAQIKLADGSILYLDSAANGELVNTNGITVTKTEDGKIVYSQLTNHDSPLTTKYNTLTNPRGSKVIDITLSDGSHVWLNAGSSITYPVAFTGTERKVTMTGEAYFEIAKAFLPSPKGEGSGMRLPFIVEANGTTTEVLGTHFNVNAYDDEADIKVTLLEGSVKVSNDVDSKIIKPGQQVSVLSGVEGSPLTTNHSPDLEQVMAWKNGLFAFNKTDLQAVMRQVARWYDLEVMYEGNIPVVKYSGKLDRSLTLNQLFDVLSETRIKYRVEEKKLIIIP